ncbi:hopanoid-associated sugar epimerase [Sabulicella glaciei]|uniref:NAD-dependent epimerase/dehydratase family protein n=1 Tax=Sabulicella glaciei TaxID=2984948 RepID=A0ABT3NUI6_9PROT|nr:hopanoid-associated sugar epimerase [Roseococcus sp. MDT2-1-1]MCW8085818.1 NAD-dependent epimerase/dehydratase family protein [Roseococcus sp. MDT2-1-1]
MPPSTILLTGATGFLGASLARELLSAGHRVRALVRPETPRDTLAGLELDWAPGSLTDRDSLRRAVAGVDAVIHAAADYRIFVPDPERMRAVNVEGTEALMRAALEAGVRRVVHVSSVATLKPRADGQPATEADAARPEEAIGPYKRSKTEAERVVEALVREAGLPAVIVNPSTPIGPYDRRPTPTGRVILEAARGKMPAYVETGLNLVHVRDCAAGVVAALDRGAVGERHILGGQDVTLAEMLRFIAAECGHRAPFRLPRAPLFPLAWVAEAAARVSGREPMLTLDGLRMARTRMFFDPSKAQRVLGFAARPWQEGVRDAIAWFREAGMLAR